MKSFLTFLTESATQQAARMGLTGDGHGGWYKDGEFVAKTERGQLKFFNKRRLTEDQDLFVREGDFVLYGNILYQIMTLGQPKRLFGQVEHKLEISAKCVRTREGQFDAR